MSYKPPFTISSEILNLVASISEQVGMLSASSLNASPQLRKQNRIKTITATLAIEGNTLTEDQVTAIVEGQRVLGTARELAEVKGAIKAYECLSTFQPNSIEDLLSAHGMMMSDILINAGKFRQKAVGIHKGNIIHHVAPPAHQVSGLMADLLNWIGSSNDHPLITSSVFHYEFEFIHPFSDGNGRMGRLWQTLILSTWHPLFLSLPLESLIKDNQHHYYQALEQADEQGESTPFIHFMLSSILETLMQNAPINTPTNAPININELKTTDAIMKLIRDNPAITRQQIAIILSKDLRTIGRAITKLQKEGKLIRVGSNKAGHWKALLP